MNVRTFRLWGVSDRLFTLSYAVQVQVLVSPGITAPRAPMSVAVRMSNRIRGFP
jgi:hypothetical protein